jgi:hypothetical protein
VGDQGLVYATFIESELKAEKERRASIEARGVSVITTSSGLVTLIAAVGAFVIRGDKFVLPGSGKVALLVAVMAFAVAAGCGIATNWSYKYTVASIADLEAMRTDQWMDDAVDSRSVTTVINAKTIKSLRDCNERKVEWLRAGQIAQLLALVALSVAVICALWVSPTRSQSPGTATHSGNSSAQPTEPGSPAPHDVSPICHPNSCSSEPIG